MSIGRDTFWTPAHLGIHLGAIVAGISSVFLILSTSFGKRRELRATSVKMWGFYGRWEHSFRCGAAWRCSRLRRSTIGGTTRLAWTAIMSPPHVVLILGIFTLGLGGLFLIVSEMNRANADNAREVEPVFLYAGCMLTILLLMLIYEYTDYTLTHSAIFYRVLALAMPPVLVGIARASGYRWAATKVGGDLLCIVAVGVVAGAAGSGAGEVGAGVTPISHLVPLEFPVFLLLAPQRWTFCWIA